MDTSTLVAVPLIDLIGLIWMFVCWIGYGVLSRAHSEKTPSLVSCMDHYRLQWMEQAAERENRAMDISLVSYLAQGPAFMASTTIFVLGGLIASWSAGGRLLEAVSALPYTQPPPLHVLQLRILVLVTIFTYAFFKFSWGARQYNYGAIVIASMPPFDLKSAGQKRAFAVRAAALVAHASESVNDGFRACYFGIAALSWLVQPWLYISSTFLVVCVLYIREFVSPTLRLVAGPSHPEANRISDQP